MPKLEPCPNLMCSSERAEHEHEGCATRITCPCGISGPWYLKLSNAITAWDTLARAPQKAAEEATRVERERILGIDSNWITARLMGGEWRIDIAGGYSLQSTVGEAVGQIRHAMMMILQNAIRREAGAEKGEKDGHS